MRRRYSYEEVPLIDENDNNNQEVRYNWNLFKSVPRETVSTSLEQSEYINISIKCLKVITVIFTFIVVLVSAVFSKGSLLFMTSQIKPGIKRPYCNKYLDTREEYTVNHPIEERTVWIWLLIFSYIIPELGTLIRSLRIISFKTWEYPKKSEFIILGVTEILPTIGSCLLAFVVFPEMDVVKAAMLTNGVCLVPALVVLTVPPSAKYHYFLDLMAIIYQISAMVVWPLVEGKLVLYVIPVSLLFISVGWWENFTSEKSRFEIIRKLAKSKKDFKNDFYYMYAVIVPIKCLIFFVIALTITWIREGDAQFLFTKFWDAFSDHTYNITQVEPIVGSFNTSYTDAIASIVPIIKETSFWTPLVVFFINISTTYVCYAFCKFACKIMIQTVSCAIPINLAVPALVTVLVSICGKYHEDVCSYADSIPEYLFFNVPPVEDLENFFWKNLIWVLWLLSQTWITKHIWANEHDKLMATENLFFKPMFDAFLIDQSIAMNRRRHQVSLRKLVDKHDHENLEVDSDKITRIYACGTMWHETKEEMVEFLKSILRMDEDQSAHRLVREYLEYNLPDYYEFETHIFFDDAFIRKSAQDNDPDVNQYVLDLVNSVSDAASKVHKVNVKIKAPVLYSTPYGGRLEWTLPGRTKMIAHLKDAAKIRRKKRWSQVMYMYYLLGYRIMDNDKYTPENIKNLCKNTYILALDGDIDFQPQSVQLLVDYMKKNPALGAACGRIHPVGSGAMAWYQIFEYAVGHWLQKATEHVIGCVLCSPGCFSLFRAGALMDENVMAKYTTESSEARHYVQYDQGEDRWLCTLLLQRGYRVEYSAASDAYTHCPEGFNEFYNQRRRWMPSTTANIMDLLLDYKHIVKINNNISRLYILYQVVLMIGTAIGPGTIFLMLVGAFVAAFKISQYYSLLLNIVPLLLFIIVCATCKSDTQLFFAGIISALYGLIMMTVFVGIMIQIESDGWLAPSSLFLLATAGEFIISALMHPQEFYCLKYGIIYYVTVPSMYMLLVIYSVFNMNNVSWGTREVTVAKQDEEEKEEEEDDVKEAAPQQNGLLSFLGSDNHNTGSMEFSFGGLFKLMCCTFDGKSQEKEILRNIQLSLQQLQKKLDDIENNDVPERRRTTKNTEHFVGRRASRASAKPTMQKVLESDAGNNEDDDDDSIYTASEELEGNKWYYTGELINSRVDFINKEEKKFWERFIMMYLEPKAETKSQKTKLAKDLKDLRDKMVLTFFMLNSLFVLVIFLLNIQQDIIHLDWPIAPKVNFTYIHDENEIIIQKTYLELQPIGFVFLIAFAGLMFVQFIAMFIHRFGTFSQIMSNTIINFNFLRRDKDNNTNEEKLLESNPVKIIKEMIRLQGIDEDYDDEEDVPVGRRNTTYFYAMKREKKAKPVIYDLDQAFYKRLSRIASENYKGSEHIPRKSIALIENRRKTVNIRKSQLPSFNRNIRTSREESFTGLQLEGDPIDSTEINA
ncbi:unnamed protein product [Phyllotreta striolata]|uniref:chitin synthase n=1 Tax=Phyllotreta striolata TaxID=444603 RepID=A0A9N9TSH1_PHYSR|nr:unnamed protein product [Phyllotreta striolata]